MILYNETPFVWGTWVSPPASTEPIKLTLGGLTSLLHEQLSYFKISVPGVDAQSDARPPGLRPVVDSILKSGTHSWEEIGHEKFLRPLSPFRWFKKDSCQLLAKEYALSTGKLPRRLAREQC